MVRSKSEKLFKRFYERTESKTSLYKVWLQIWLQANSVPTVGTLVYIDQQNKMQTTLFQKSSDHQNFLNVKSEHPYPLKKSIPFSHFKFNKYAQHYKTTTASLENLLSNLLMKDTKKVLSYSKFRRLTNSIKNDCSTNKYIMINNGYHYQ